MSKKKILFICTGNTCRSAMAEVLARKAVEEIFPDLADIEFASAGIAALPNTGATPQAIQVMRERGIDLSAHKSAQVSPEDIEAAALVLTMTTGHRDNLRRIAGDHAEKIYALAEYAGTGSDIHDPFGMNEEAYRIVAGELNALVRDALRRFRGQT